MKNPLVGTRRFFDESTFLGVANMKIRTQILAGFMVIFVLLIINSAMMFWSVSSLVNSEMWVTHSHDVIAKTRTSEKLIVDMETGERGFLITGDDEFLGPMEAAEREQIEIFDALTRLVSDNPKQLQRLNEIKALETKWKAVAASPEIAERRKVTKGSIDADYLQNLLVQGLAKSIFDELRAQADKLDKFFERSGQNEARYLVLQIVKNMVDMETGERGFLVAGAEVFLEPYQKASKIIEKQFDGLRSVVAKTAGSDKNSVLADVDILQALHQKWLTKGAEPEIEARREMNKSSTSLKTVAALISKKKGKLIVDELRVRVGEFVAVEQHLLEERNQQAARAAWSSMFVVGIGTVLAILCGFIAMGLVSRNVLRQVGGEPGEIAAIAEQISTGNLELDIPGDEKLSTGILSSVRRMLDSLRQSKKASEQRDWSKTGVVRVNEVMRGEEDIVNLAAKVVSEICTSLDAKVGALYVMDEQEEGGPALSLLGSYAYTKRKNISNRFRLGEGIVGQAAIEKQQILIKNIPEDYVRVVSGLGESLPRFICATPLVYEGRVMGVLEIGTLTKLSDVELDYLSQTTPLTAIAFESAKSRVALRDALRKSEGLSNSLQVQQEELKTSNEELEDQARALQQSEEKLKTQQEELEVINEELEEKNKRLTQQKRDVEDAQQAIAEKVEEVALASKYKSEFLANMSHELRTPLNSLLLLARSLRDNKEGNLTKGQTESAGIIYGAGNDLLALINEILDLSKIEAGRMSLDLEGVALEDLAQNIKDSFQHMAADKSLGFGVELSDDVCKIIITDPKKLQQILKNLIANALKFTETGRVDVTFHAPAPGVNLSRSGIDRKASIAISVVDTGIGIARDQQKAVFEAFRQADGSTSRKYGGTGLGLSISRELAKLLGGEIQLQSVPGEGSTFTVYLPREIKSVEEGGKSSPIGGGGAQQSTTAAATEQRPKTASSVLAD
ncbi:MAG: CHASE3 domain-containing protein, partial [Byssovorax sp.]